MLYREIIAVCSEIHTKHINTLCGQNVEFVDVKPGRKYSGHWPTRGLIMNKLVNIVLRNAVNRRLWTCSLLSKRPHVFSVHG